MDFPALPSPNHASRCFASPPQPAANQLTVFRLFLCGLTGWLTYVGGMNLILLSPEFRWADLISNLSSADSILDGSGHGVSTSSHPIPVVSPDFVRVPQPAASFSQHG